MSIVLEEAKIVLEEAKEPLHGREITQRILARGRWKTEGQTPDATVSSQLSLDINNHFRTSLFQRTGKGVFALRAWGLPEFNGKVDRVVPTDGLTEIVSMDIPDRVYTFTDAAERVLEQFKKPMHYRDITDKALELGLIKTQGRTPEATLHARIGTEIERMTKQGKIPRFKRSRKGLVWLSRWMPSELPLQIEQDSKMALPSELPLQTEQDSEMALPPDLSQQIKHHNNEVRQKLHNRLYTIPPGEFESLIGELLGKMGFEIEVTSPSNDGGIDVRGTLVIGDAIHVRMAVQVKRWQDNIHRTVVQQVRGSLGHHEQGLIVTTSDFSPGARQEAARPDAVPVALMNGEQLVDLLVEHTIGIHRTTYDLIELNGD